MKNKLETLIELGITKKAIADRLGIDATNITKYINYNVPIASKHEKALDEFLIEINNKIIKILMEEN